MRTDLTSRQARSRARWTRTILYVALTALTIPFAYPLWWMVTSSFKPVSEIGRTPPTFWPENLTLDGYVRAFELQPLLQQYWNSVYIAVLVTAGTVVVSSVAGYAFARIRFPGANAIFLVVLVGILVPSEVTIIPLFQLVNALGLIDTHWPLIVIPILGAPAVLATFIMRQFFLGIPTELEEAGRIDGLTRNGIFWRIAFPLAGPAVAAVAIITFLRSWNLFLEPLIFLNTKANFTLPLALTQYQEESQGLLWDAQLAATTLTVAPVLIVFLFAQRQFVEGLAQTGRKG